MIESRNMSVPLYKGSSAFSSISNSGGKGMGDFATAGIGSAIGGVGQVWSAKVQAKAAGKASESQERMATKSADIQAKLAENQLNFVKGESKNLRADSEISRRGNFDLSQVEDRNVGSRYNIGNQLNAASFNADAANKRGEFNANRGDTIARYGALANDRSNIRAMLNAPGWTPATFAAIDPLERVTAGVYTPEEAKYLPGYVPPDNAA